MIRPTVLRKAAAAAIVALISVPLVAQATDDSSTRPVYVPSELIVRFSDGATAEQIGGALSAIQARVVRTYRRVPISLIRVPEDILELAREHLARLAFVEYAELNYYRYIDVLPNDARFTDLWGMDNFGQTGGAPDADIDAPEAWDIQTGNQNMVVAVIDSGIELNHPDLADNIWVNTGEIPGNGIDDDGNGYVDDVVGWDFADNDNDPTDTTVACASHGIHTSGTVGARGNNDIGVTGVNWRVRIMPLRAFRPFLGIFCSGSDAAIIAAIDYAADKGVRVSNNSYGGGPASQAVFDAIQASRSVFVTSAGNSGTNNDSSPQFPASYDLPNIVSVAATDDSDQLASFSNFGAASVDLAAPGVEILSTVRNGAYGLLSGTSMASPHVAGAAALLMANDPSLTNKEVVWRIRNSTDFKGFPLISGGRLNLRTLLLLPPPIVEIKLTPDGPTTISPGDNLPYTVTLKNLAASAKTVHAQVLAMLPNGREVVLLDRNLVVPPLFEGSQSFIQAVPAQLAAGEYVLAATAEVISESFDENQVNYSVVP